MAHTTPEMIEDLSQELSVIRKLDGMKEKSFGIFYFKANPFLHFHHKDGKRWADVKTLKGFQSVPINFSAKLSERRSFLKSVESAYLTLSERKSKK